MEQTYYDTLNWSKDKDIRNIIKDETLYYSNKIQKINHYNISQERYFVLTNEAIYNIQKKKLKRKMKYSEIRGITFTKLSSEFVVHGIDGEYDYYFQSPEKNILICLIAKFYEEQTKSTLKLCEVQDKSLKMYVTGKKEIKKDGFSTKMDENRAINTKSFIKEILRTDKKLRQISKDNLSDSYEENSKKDKITIIFNKIEGIKDIRVEDFQITKILGRGAFGKVYLVQYKPFTSYTYYAMKSIKKEYLNDINEINKNLIDNQNIQNLDYKFLIGTKLCFTSEERIYFIMNLIHGEDILSCIRLNHTNFFENQIKFYAVIIGLTIDYLHNNGNILKDLRLDNIIIDKDGYLKITDFKICQLFNMKNDLALMKETSEYLAPEVISANECHKESDWWSYGIILYQLLYGIPPFYSEDDKKIRQQIVQDELRFPKNTNVSQDAKDLLKLLLNKNYNERLGSVDGFDEIKKHKFFESVNIDDIINKRVRPDYLPNMGNILKTKETYVEYTYEDLINSQLLIN
jgi:tRNA A-37 threonylcarbamoyl transferase component Bud32